jgi:predicted secreted Zn-dependent protease
MPTYSLAPAKLDWRVSRACEGGACVMVTRNGDSVIFGNTTTPDGPTYSYTTAEWQQFVVGVKQGDFDDIA